MYIPAANAYANIYHNFRSSQSDVLLLLINDQVFTINVLVRRITEGKRAVTRKNTDSTRSLAMRPTWRATLHVRFSGKYHHIEPFYSYLN